MSLVGHLRPSPATHRKEKMEKPRDRSRVFISAQLKRGRDQLSLKTTCEVTV